MVSIIHEKYKNHPPFNNNINYDLYPNTIISSWASYILKNNTTILSDIDSLADNEKKFAVILEKLKQIDSGDYDKIGGITYFELSNFLQEDLKSYNKNILYKEKLAHHLNTENQPKNILTSLKTSLIKKHIVCKRVLHSSLIASSQRIIQKTNLLMPDDCYLSNGYHLKSNMSYFILLKTLQATEKSYSNNKKRKRDEGNTSEDEPAHKRRRLL